MFVNWKKTHSADINQLWKNPIHIPMHTGSQKMHCRLHEVSHWISMTRMTDVSLILFVFGKFKITYIVLIMCIICQGNNSITINLRIWWIFFFLLLRINSCFGQLDFFIIISGSEFMFANSSPPGSAADSYWTDTIDPCAPGILDMRLKANVKQ